MLAFDWRDFLPPALSSDGGLPAPHARQGDAQHVSPPAVGQTPLVLHRRRLVRLMTVIALNTRPFKDADSRAMLICFRREYIDAIVRHVSPERIHISTSISSLTCHGETVILLDEHGVKREFDQVILA
jgi:predicted NAD/FAD-binding protein